MTEVRVRLLADETVAAAARELRVSIRGEDDELMERNVRIDEDGTFPFEVPVVPRGGDSERTFELLAEVLDGAGESLGSQRVLANFADGEQRTNHRAHVPSEISERPLRCRPHMQRRRMCVRMFSRRRGKCSR